MTDAALLPEATRLAPPVVASGQRTTLIVGGVAAVIAIILGIFNPAEFFRSYLIGWILFMQITFGCLILGMIHSLSKGAWGALTRPLLNAGAMMMPVMGLLLIPLFFGLTYVYIWTHPDAVAVSHNLQYKSRYLNTPFFILRAVLYFVVWSTLAYFMRKWWRLKDLTDDHRYQARLERMCGAGILLSCLMATFAFIDWMMSLEPYFASTMFPVILGVGGILGAHALCVLVISLLYYRPPMSAVMRPPLLNDLGGLLLAFTMAWAYTSLGQFLLVWHGNLPEEIPWYLNRVEGSWVWYGRAVIVLFFAVPFYLLCFRPVKRDPKWLGILAAFILLTRYLDVIWLVAPVFHPGNIYFHPLYLLTPIAIGGIWLSLFSRFIRQQPLLMLNVLRLRAHGHLDNSIH